jgi:mercuric ion transport protein
MRVKEGNHAAESGMRDRTLVATGALGAALAAICCLTPLLAFVLGAVGLTAWLAKADYVLIPVLILGLGLFAAGIYRRWLRVQIRQ